MIGRWVAIGGVMTTIGLVTFATTPKWHPTPVKIAEAENDIPAVLTDQNQAPENHKIPLKGAYPDLFEFHQPHSRVLLTFPVSPDFQRQEGTIFEAENDKVGRPYFVGYEGLEQKVIRGLSKSEAEEYIGKDINQSLIRGFNKHGSRYGITARAGRKGDERWGEMPKGIAKVDIIQRDISGNGFACISIGFKGDVGPKELKRWLLQMVDEYKLELEK